MLDLSIGLRSDEEVLWSGNPSRLGFSKYYFGFVILSIILGAFFGLFLGEPALGLIVGFIILGLLLAILESRIRSIKYFVTNERVIEEIDWVRRSIESLQLENATDVQLEQSWVGKMVDLGTVNVITAGSVSTTSEKGKRPGIELKAIKEPTKVARKISTGL